jgi:hypothetical protein
MWILRTMGVESGDLDLVSTRLAFGNTRNAYANRLAWRKIYERLVYSYIFTEWAAIPHPARITALPNADPTI